MPDQLSNLNATGVGQLPTQFNIPKLPQVNFTDLPTFVNAPSFMGPTEVGQGGISLPGFKPIDPSLLDRVTPQPFDNRHISKLRNSTVFEDLGYNRNSNEEDRYDKAQPWWEATKNSGIKLGMRTWDSFISFFKQNVDTFNALTNAEVEKSWNTEANIDKLAEQDEIDTKYPNFTSASGTNWWSFIPFTSGSGDWWESFVPQLGFTLGTIGGAIAQNAIVGLLTEGAGLAVTIPNSIRQVYGAITGFNRLKTAANAMAAGKNIAINGMKVGLTGWNFYNTAASEASFEATHKYGETKDYLTEAFKSKYGYMPIGEELARIDKAALNAGNNTFKGNVPVLMASNAVMFGNVLFPSWAKSRALSESIKGFQLGVEGTGAASKIVAKDLAESTFKEIWKAGNILDRTKLLSSYLINDKTRFLSEGLEEVAQRAVSSGSMDFALDGYFGNRQSASKSIKYGINDIFTSEGWQEFIGGAMGGLMFQTTGSLARRMSKGDMTVNEDGSIVYDETLLNKLGIYSKSQLKETRRQRAESIASILNHDTLKDVFQEEGFKNLFIQNRNSAIIEDASKSDDIFNMQNARHDSLNRFLYAALKTGKIDLRIKQLQDLKNLDNDEIKELLGIEAKDVDKDNMHKVIDSIAERAKEFEKVYKKESPRFDSALSESLSEYKTSLKTYNETRDELLKKYGQENIEDVFEPLEHMYSTAVPAMRDAADEHEFMENYQKLTESGKSIATLTKDYWDHRRVLGIVNQALINYTAVEEGKKSAIFSFSEMLDSAERGRSILKELKDESDGLDFYLVENLLDKNTVNDEIKKVKEYHKNLINPTTAEEAKSRKNLEKQLEILEEINKMYEANADSKDIAEEIMDYLLIHPRKDTKQSFMNWDYSGEQRIVHEKKVKDIVDLQKRHQENLNLYNRLQESTFLADFKRHESDIISDFLERAYNYHVDRMASKLEKVMPGDVDPQPVNAQATKEQGETTQPTQTNQPNNTTEFTGIDTTQSSQPTSTTPVPNAVEVEISRLAEKFQKEGKLEQVEIEKLQVLAAVNPTAKELLDIVTKAMTASGQPVNESPYKKGETVIHVIDDTNSVVEIIYDVQPDKQNATKWLVSFESSPGKYVSEDDIAVRTKENVEIQKVKTGYLPESDKQPGEVRQDEVFDNHQRLEHRAKAGEDNRTIVDEVIVSTINQEQPTLDPDPNTRFKQRFMDLIGTSNRIEGFEGHIEIATKEHFIPGSAAYKWMESNPDSKSVVLVVTDTKGNRLFDNNFLADPNGNPLTFSLINSKAKNELLSTMVDNNVNTIPVDLASISHGMFDRLENNGQPIKRKTSELIEGIPTLSWQFVVAKALKGDVYFTQNGITLRNGGFYIRTGGSFIKVYPGFVNEMSIPGTDYKFDVKALMTNIYPNREQALNVVNFLETIFYTNSEKGGVSFDIHHYDNKQGKTRYKIISQVWSGDHIVPYTLDETIGLLKGQRLNVIESLLGGVLTAYSIENGDLKSVQVAYNDFLANNSTTDKKAYTMDSVKVLKPVNRYITLGEPLVNIKDRLTKSIERQQQEEADKRATEERKGKPAEEVKPARRPGRRQRPQADENLEDLFRPIIGVNRSIEASEIDWVRNRFGRNAVQLSRIANSRAWGVWTRSGIILYKNAAIGTGYHEAWHHFTQMYLTKQQKQDLYNEARDRVPKLKGKSDLVVEEYLAEDFREYMQTNESKVLKGRPKRNTIFRMIIDLLKRLFGSKQTIDRAYRELHKGTLWGYNPTVKNAIFGKLYARIVDSKGSELFDNVKGTRYIRYMDSMLGQVLHEKGWSQTRLNTGNAELDRKALKSVYLSLRDKLEDEYDAIYDLIETKEAKGEDIALLEDTVIDLNTILDNYPIVFRQFRALSGLSIQEDDIEERTRFEQEISQHEADIETSVETIDTDEAKEANFGGKPWDATGQDVSLLQSSAEETKSLIRTLSEVQVDERGMPLYGADGKVRLKRNNYGLTEPVSFTQMFNNLGLLLEGSRTLAEMYGRMNDSENQRKFPELALLLERLPDMNAKLKLAEVMLLTRFAKDFGKIYNPIYSLVKLKNGIFIFKEETKRTKDIIERQWSNNFFNRTEEDPYVAAGHISIDENRRPFISYNANLNYDFNKQQDIDSFLELLGIRFSKLAKESAEYRQEITPINLNRLLGTIKQRLKFADKITNPIKDLKKEFKRSGIKSINSETKILNIFSELESKYSTESPSLSYRNAEGNMQHGLSLVNWLLQNNIWLSRTRNYKEILDSPEAQHLNYRNNPYIRNSMFLNYMFDLNPNSPTFGQRRRVVTNSTTGASESVVIEIGNYNGIKYAGGVAERDNLDEEGETQTNEPTETTGASTTSLSPREKLIMDFNSLLSSGAIEIMRTESAASAYFVKLNNYAISGTQHLPFTTEELNGNVNHPRLLQVFEGYFEDELASIINLYDSQLPGYNDSKVGPGRFSLFKEIFVNHDIDRTNPQRYSHQDAILKTIKERKEEGKLSTFNEKMSLIKELKDYHRANLLYAVQDFFIRDIKELGEIMYSRGITTNDFSEKLTKRKDGSSVPPVVLLTSFVVNDFILNIEYSKLFSGNVAFFKAYHKRSKADISTGTKPMIDSTLVDYLGNTHDRTLAFSMGLPAETDITATKTVVIKDDERKSVHIDSMRNALMKLNGWTKEEAEKVLGSDKNSAYYNMTVADGQGHCTLDFYRKFRLATSTWNYSDEDMYEKEVITFRRRNNLYEALGNDQKIKDDVFMETHKDVISWFPPIKMQYNGPTNVAGVFAPVNDKFSIAPLIPSSIEDTKWEAMNLQLIKKGIGYTKFKSGTKKYQHPAVDFYGNDWNVEISDNQIATHFTSYLKEQVETKAKPKDKSTWGTQMRKLFMANLYSIGTVENPKFNRILQDYKKILDSIEEDNKNSLFKEFGITEAGDTYTIKNIKKFVDSLQSEISRRKLNENIKDSIQLSADGKLLWPLEINLNKAVVQDLIAGMLFKKLTQLKINGDMLIQVATSGFERNDFKYTNSNAADIARYGTNGLSFYEMEYDSNGDPIRTRAMKVKVALTKEWKKLLKRKHPDGNSIGTRERLNQLLQDESWVESNRKSLTMIGYRIPTQGINSMEFMEIGEFLPEVAGSIIILPAEIVAKSGSDFDIDKMNIFRPSFTTDGDFVSEDNVDIIEKDIADTKNAIDALFKAAGQGYSELLDEEVSEEEVNTELDLIDANQELRNLILRYRELIKSGRQSMYTNQVMDLYRETLESPEMFTQLVTPNSTDLVRPIAMKMAGYHSLYIGDFQNTDILRYSSNLTKFEQLLSGKKDLGVFALANTASQLFQQSGMMLNRSYKVYPPSGGQNVNPQSRTVTLKLFSPEEREQIIKDDKIDFSNRLNAEGVLKQEYFSQMINSTVDIASDPYYTALGFNRETLGVAVYLIHLGVPFDRIVRFVNQPIIKHYVDTLLRFPDPKHKKKVKYAIANRQPVNISKGTPGFDKFIEIRDTQRSEEFFDDAALEDAIADANTNYSSYYEDNRQDTQKGYFQNNVFAHFLKLQEQSQLLRELQGTTNFDTVKFLSPISVESNFLLRERVGLAGLFDSNAVQKIRTDSLISAFNNLHIHKAIYKTIMPVGMSNSIVYASAKLMQEFFAAKIGRLKLERVLNNDWVEFIIKNFGEVDGINIEILGEALVREHPSGRTVTLAQELGDLKRKYPGLNHYELIRRLYSNLSQKDPALKNIELYRGLDNSSDMQNTFIENYNELKDFKGTEIPGLVYSLDQAAEISTFFNKLQYLAFHQSGFNRSFISFLDIVPHRELSDMFTVALRRYHELTKGNSALEETIISSFINAFRVENPKFKLLEEGMQGNAENWRGKHYFIPGLESGGVFVGRPAIPPVITEDLDPSLYHVVDMPALPPISGKNSVSSPMENSLDPSEITNHSGGALGSDLSWDSIGREFGVTNHRHYRPEDLNKADATVRKKIEEDVNKAARGLGRPVVEFKGKDLVRRNWFQVNGADSIFAIGYIIEPGAKDPKGYINKSGKQIVAGGTGWAVEMAIQKGKPVFVFDQASNKWYTWDLWQNRFVETTVPTLTKNFAGIGTREITQSGLDAIRSVYQETFGMISTQPKSEGVIVLQPGFGVYKNALTKEEHDKILGYALAQLKAQGYHVKKAVAYAHWGKMWAVNDRGNEGFPVFGRYLKKDANGKIDLPKATITSAESVDSPHAKQWYNYYETDQNGRPLAQIPQEIKDIVKAATGYDVTEHDAAIINAYGDGTVLTRHVDNTEDTTARGKAIVSINLINPGKFYYGEGSANSANSNPDNKEVMLDPGDIAIFGGPSRFMPHRVDVGSGNALHVDLADGTNGIDARRINITIRRVMPVASNTQPDVSFVDYSQEPGFRDRNPNFNHDDYVNSVDKFGKNSELPENLKPYLSGINISTRSEDPLGRALTNPVWGSRKDGKHYFDVEAWYKANASKIKAPELNAEEALKYDMNLMFKGMVHKFNQNPELIQEITDRGGVDFLKSSSHIVGTRGSRWEGQGENSNFIKVLIAAYNNVLSNQNKGQSDNTLGFINKKEEYYTIVPHRSFEGKAKILAQAGVHKSKQGYYYVLDAEQKAMMDRYRAKSRGQEPGSSAIGFELSSTMDRDVYLRVIDGVSYLYIDLKELSSDGGVLLPKVYGRVRVKVDLLGSKELQDYLNTVQRGEIYVPNHEIDARRFLFKAKGITQGKAASFYLVKLRQQLSEFLRELGANDLAKNLKNIDNDKVEDIKDVIDLDKRVKQIKDRFKATVDSMSAEELVNEVHNLYVDKYDADTLDGIWKIVNHLPTSFLKLLAFEHTFEQTAFFRGDDIKNRAEDKRIDIGKLDRHESIVYGLSINVALRKMKEDGLITDQDVANLNILLEPSIAEFMLFLKANNIWKQDEIGKIQHRFLKKSKVLDGYDKKYVIDGRTVRFATLFYQYRDSAVDSIMSSIHMQDKGLMDVYAFINKIQHKSINKVFTNITMGNLDGLDLRFPIDYPVIAGHELGHALDYYMQTTKPKLRANILNVINALVALPEFEDYLDKGLYTRGYPLSNKKEIIADVYSWMITKGAGYDMGKSHIKSFDDFVNNHIDKVENIFRDYFPEFFEKRLTVSKKSQTVGGFLKSIIKDFIDWINDIFGAKVYTIEDKIDVNSEIKLTPEQKAKSITALVKSLERLTMSDDVFDIDSILDSESQADFHMVDIASNEAKSLANRIEKHIKSKKSSIFTLSFYGGYNNNEFEKSAHFIYDQLSQGGSPMDNTMKLLDNDEQLVDDIITYFQNKDKDTQSSIDKCLG